MLAPRELEALLDDFRARRPIRAGSLIVTIYGDALAPHGGSAWLGSLVPLLKPFGIKPNLVRTALSRLVNEGWLTRIRVGRLSFFSLTDGGRHRFAEATRRIYFRKVRAWSGGWHFVLLPEGPEGQRLKTELGWIGFGRLQPGLLIHPAPDAAALETILADFGNRNVIVGRAKMNDAARTLIARCWDLAGLAKAYRDFLGRFKGLHRALSGKMALRPYECLLARLLLIHDYRRLILRDPLLPKELMPANWAGAKAHELAGDIYRALIEPSERWLGQHVRTSNGPLPPAAARLSTRFRARAKGVRA
jgi:phenylacetic acid degradation operon negative regulatory protein